MNKRLLTYSSYLYLMSYAFTVTLMGPCNGPIAAAFGANERAMGMLISTHFAGFIVTTMLAGYVIDRAGLKPVVVAGVAVLGASLIGFGRAWSLPSLFVMMFLTGVGGGAVEAAVNALIARMYPKTRVYNLNMLHIFFGIGAFTWPTVAGYMLAGGASWRTLYVMVGVFSLAAAALMSVQKFPAVDEAPAGGLRDMLAVLRRPTVLLLGGVIALYVGGEMGINAWIVRYFDEELLNGNPLSKQLSLALAGRDLSFTITTSIFLTLYWFTMTAGRLLATMAGKWLPDIVLLRIVTTGSAVCAVATFLVRDVTAAAVFLGLTGLFFSGIFATTIAIGSNRYPQHLGLVSGAIITFSGLGNVVLNAAIGEIAQSTGSIRMGMLFAAALLAGMAACAFAIKKTPSSETP